MTNTNTNIINQIKGKDMWELIRDRSEKYAVISSELVNSKGCEDEYQIKFQDRATGLKYVVRYIENRSLECKMFEETYGKWDFLPDVWDDDELPVGVKLVNTKTVDVGALIAKLQGLQSQYGDNVDADLVKEVCRNL